MASGWTDVHQRSALPKDLRSSGTVDARVDLVLEQFRAAGGRVTSPRRAIVEVLLGGDSHEHLTADEVSVWVRRNNPEIAVSTVYRSLDALEGLGVIEHVHVGHGPTVYHLAGEAHVHLVCRLCGVVLEMADAGLQAMRAEVLDRHGFVIEPRHFAIHGVCASCHDGGDHDHEQEHGHAHH